MSQQKLCKLLSDVSLVRPASVECPLRYLPRMPGGIAWPNQCVILALRDNSRNEYTLDVAIAHPSITSPLLALQGGVRYGRHS